MIFYEEKKTSIKYLLENRQMCTFATYERTCEYFSPTGGARVHRRGTVYSIRTLFIFKYKSTANILSDYS